MNPFEQVFYPTITAGCALGIFLTWKASGCDAPGKRQVLMLLSFVIVWMSLFLGVHFGYGAWQTMPDPPDRAFADGAKLTGSLMFGWIPSGLACLLTLLVCRVLRRVSRRGDPRSTPTPTP